MRGIILAAGRGKRLGQTLPKCLQPIGNKTILHRQLDALQEASVKETVFVIGYQGDKVKKAVREYWPNQAVFVKNPEYETTNTSYSLYLARQYMDEDFFYMNADVVFRPDLLRRLISNDGDASLGIVVKPCGSEEVKVTAEQFRISAIGKNLSPEQCLGEFVGIGLFRKKMLGCFKESLRSLIEDQGMTEEYFEGALAKITNKVVMKAVDITDIPCIEIDFPEDLELAQKHSSDFDRDGTV